MGFFDHRKAEAEELKLLREENKTLREILDVLKLAAKQPVLSFIKIQFGGIMPLGPVTLTVGQKTKATVKGFDQNGAPFQGVIPSVNFTVDNSALDSETSDGANGADIVSLAAGVATLQASLTTAEGKQLSDTETITNLAQTAVLSSIKVDFSTPA